MLGALCPYDCRKHVVIHPADIEQWLNRSLPENIRRDLLIYFHTEAHTFVIAQRIKPYQFIDLCNLGGSLRNFDRLKAGHLLALLKNPGYNSLQEIKEELRAGDSRYWSGMQDTAGEGAEKFERSRSSKITVGFS